MTRKPPAPPATAVLAEIVSILGKHRLSPLGGHWQCACGQDYGPRTRSINGSATARAQHDMHTARVLVAEGLTLGAADPRENFIRRARQGKPS